MIKKKIIDLSIFGGKKIFKIPISTSSLAKPNRNTLINLLKKDLTNPEKIIKKFENKMNQFHCSKYCVSFCNGFWALVNTMEVLKIQNKNEAILPSLTYRRLADVCSWAGLVPNFCDIDEETLAIDVEKIQKKINKKTSIIIAVSPMIAMLDYKKLSQINKKIPVIIDNVEHANFRNLDSTYAKTLTQVYSLHASKLVNGGEGGYVITNNKTVYSKLIKKRGKFEKKNCSNFNLNPAHAMVALASLKNLDGLINHNKKIYDLYKKTLQKNKFFEFVKHQHKNLSYKMILIKLKDSIKIKGDKIIKILNNENVLARPYYNPPLHKKKLKYNFIAKNLSITNLQKDKYIVMPSGFKTSYSDVRKTLKLLNFIVKNQTKIIKYEKKIN